MADTLGSINNLLRRTKYTNQDELNAIRHAFLEQQEEEKGFDRKARVSKIREKVKLTDSWTIAEPDVQMDESVFVRNGNLIIQSAVSSHSAYPVTHTENGSISWDVRNGTKLGAYGRFQGSAYVSIPHNAAVDVGISQSFTFWFKFEETNAGTRTVFCKKDESTSTNAGIHISLTNGQTADYQSGSGAFDSDYSTASSNAKITTHIADGTNEVTANHEFANLDDGNWHCITVNIGDLGADYASGSGAYDTDYKTTATETIETFVDGSSVDSTSITSITGSLSNSRLSYIGGRDNGGTIDQKMYGTLAWFFWEGVVQSTSDVTDFHSNNIFHSNAQVSAVSFEGSVENTTLDNY